MKSKSAISLAVMSLALITGCATVYDLDLPRDPTGTPTVKSIVQQIRCELADLANPADPDHQLLTGRDFMVAVQLDLNVNGDGSLAPSFLYTNGVFSFNAGAKFDVSKTQDFTERLLFSLKSIRHEIKVASDIGESKGLFECPAVIDTPLAGNLGLRESVRMALRSPNLDYGTGLSGSNGVFGGFVQFVITKNVNAVGPNWKLVHLNGPGSLAGISQVNTDKLTFAFAEKSPVNQYASETATTKAEALISHIIESQTTSELARISSKL